jgi:bacterioferritin-associated ferredoxin
MIICSCNVLSDHDVRGVIDASGSPLTAAQVYGCLDCVPECGRCVPTIRSIMADASDGDSAAAS